MCAFVWSRAAIRSIRGSLSHGVRVGLEDLYRAVNERIQELTAPGSGDDGADTPNGYVCECGDPNCRTNISLRWEEFAEIAAEPDTISSLPVTLGATSKSSDVAATTPSSGGCSARVNRSSGRSGARPALVSDRRVVATSSAGRR